MRRANSIIRLERRIEALSIKLNQSYHFHGFIYADEDRKLVHAFGPNGKEVTASIKTIRKAIREAFELSKKDIIYLIISQFKTRSIKNEYDSQKALPDGKQNVEPLSE